MAVIELGKGRAIIENDGTGLRITIPAANSFFGTSFIGLWLIGWAFGEFAVLYHMFIKPPKEPQPAFTLIFLIVWLALWTMGGVWALITLLWGVAGKEVIELTSTTPRHRKQIPIFSRSRDYAVASIANLRPASLAPALADEQHNMGTALNFREGAIAFDYGRATHHLGADLDEADAKYVIGEMCKRVKSLRA
jgi:hypothetical protein